MKKHFILFILLISFGIITGCDEWLNPGPCGEEYRDDFFREAKYFFKNADSATSSTFTDSLGLKRIFTFTKSYSGVCPDEKLCVEFNTTIDTTVIKATATIMWAGGNTRFIRPIALGLNKYRASEEIDFKPFFNDTVAAYTVKVDFVFPEDSGYYKSSQFLSKHVTYFDVYSQFNKPK